MRVEGISRWKVEIPAIHGWKISIGETINGFIEVYG